MRGGWDCVALIYFVCCGVSRLARYNVTAEALSEGADKVAYFEGTPIPTSVVLTGCSRSPRGKGASGEQSDGGAWSLGPWELHPLVAAVRALRLADDQQDAAHPEALASGRRATCCAGTGRRPRTARS